MLNILSEVGLLGCRAVNTPMNTNVKLLSDHGENLDNLGRYRRLVRKLNYLMVTRPDIAFSVSVISQFLSAPKISHWNAALQILRYLKKALGKGLLYSDCGHTRVADFSDTDWAGSPIVHLLEKISRLEK